MCRAFGCSAPAGTIYAINPFMIILLVPILGAMTTHISHFDMIHYGESCRHASEYLGPLLINPSKLGTSQVLRSSTGFPYNVLSLSTKSEEPCCRSWAYSCMCVLCQCVVAVNFRSHVPKPSKLNPKPSPLLLSSILVLPGSYLYAASPFWMVAFQQLWAACMFAVQLSVGEALWSPRYAGMVAV
jgi:hypothetical protein